MTGFLFTVNLYRPGYGPDGIPGNADDANVVATQPTAGGGAYNFTGLIPGDYYVEVIKPAGYSFSPLDQGGDDALDSDADEGTGVMATTTLVSGENDLTWDAGLRSSLPTAAGLAYFRAMSARANGVVLSWGTLVEVGTLGFYVERAIAASGWERVTAQMIPATGQNRLPQSYVSSDPQGAAKYRLIEIELTGREVVLAEAAVSAGVTVAIEWSPSGLKLNLQGQPNTTAVVETAASVVGPWTVLETVALDPRGAGSVSLGTDTGEPARFYRVLEE